MQIRHAILATALLLSTFSLQAFSPSASAANAARALNNVNRRGQANLQRTNRMANRNTNRNNADADNLIANIDESWYLELTPGYASASGGDIDTYWGATLALGYRLTENDKIQLEIGYYRSGNFTGPTTYTQNFAYDATVAGAPVVTAQPASMTVTGSRKTGPVTAIPVILSYSYCFRLDAQGRYEFRLAPAAGILSMTSGSWSVENITGSFTAPPETLITNVYSDDASFTPANISPDGRTISKTNAQIRGRGATNNIAPAFGGGVGFTYNFAPRAYVDIGYRFLWTTKVRNQTPAGWNSVTAWNGMNMHFYTLTLGWKF